ncbi:MAG: TonB C-terminal domain-containing protein [Campylobacterota bacterium]|nr:TonB C-terminal domain-containing protein [Campylobacterota bacterium]
MDNKNLFLFSAVSAISIYLIIMLSLVYYTLSRDVKKIDSVTKATVLQLDIVLDDSQSKKSIILSDSNINDQTKKAKEVVKKSTSQSVKKRTNLKSLFAKVSTKAPTVKKEKVLNIKKNTISSRFKSKFEKEKKVEKLSLSKLSKNKQKSKVIKTATQSKNDSDPYYSKIYDIISSRWSPTIFNDNLEAKIIIIISNNGSFSYQFIQYSNNIGFDKQLREFLNNETLNKYPSNPNGNTTKIEIIFKSKGE